MSNKYEALGSNIFGFEIFEEIFKVINERGYTADEQMFKGKVKCFGYEEFRKMVENNIPFWNKCREIVRDIVEQQLQQVV